MVVPTVWLIASSTGARHYGIEWMMDPVSKQLVHTTACLLTYVTSLASVLPELTSGAKHKVYVARAGSARDKGTSFSAIVAQTWVADVGEGSLYDKALRCPSLSQTGPKAPSAAQIFSEIH